MSQNEKKLQNAYYDYYKDNRERMEKNNLSALTKYSNKNNGIPYDISKWVHEKNRRP
ncbi:hypothetical protein [Salibacterium aidingense]|uniref:hypothetical protein n=1 Tax=Salibacterium aidingense TaxID=384933 RepID=UPI0004154143|nr:hypothetical protein [Salibacterium aidingense]